MMLILTFEAPPRGWDHLGKGQELDKVCRREPEVEMRMMKRMRVESSRRKKSTYIDIWSLRCSRRRAHTAKILTHGREAKKPSALAADADPRHITLESIVSR
ncbi:hypothetical protein HDV63DRAFT_144493 [Trichoderma sp. SZMC 28014]